MDAYFISELQMLQRQVATLTNRLEHLFKIGQATTPTNETTGTATAQIQHSPVEVHDGVGICQQFGFASSPPVGSALLTLAMGGDANKKIIVGSHHDASRPTGTPSGGTVIYDAVGSQIRLASDGMVIVSIAGTPILTVNSTGIQVVGTIQATQNMTGAGISLNQHQHVSEAAGTPTSSPIAGT